MMEEENKVLNVQLIKLENIIGDVLSSTTYSCKEVEYCISSYMQCRGISSVKTEPHVTIVPIINEKTEDIKYEHTTNYHTLQKAKFQNFIVQQIFKEEPSYQAAGNPEESQINPLVISENRSVNEDSPQPSSSNNWNARTSVSGEKRIGTSVLRNEAEIKHLEHNTYKNPKPFNNSEMLTMKYRCKDCSESFIKKMKLKVHIDSVHKIIKCEKCPKVFSSIRCLKKHIRVVHVKNNNFNSEECSRMPSKKRILELHSSVSHKNIKVKCQKRKKVYYNRSNYKRHLAVVQKKLECQECDWMFLRRKDLKKHIEADHLGIRIIQCKECKKTFSTITQLTLHDRAIHKQIENFKCGECQKIFSNYTLLKEHIETVHKQIKTFQCDECQKMFYSTKYLKKHVKSVHNGVSKIQCDKCKKIFFSLTVLRTHNNTVHKKIRNFECNVCQKTFLQKVHLKNHVNSVHEKIRNFKCDHCEKMFYRLDSIMIHIKAVHSKMKDYECNECQKRFVKFQNLQLHINGVHNKIKKFKCKVCFKMYCWPSLLKTHISRTHEKIKHTT